MHMYDRKSLQPRRFQALPSWDDDICFRLQNSLMNKNTTTFSKVCALYEYSKIVVMRETSP